MSYIISISNSNSDASCEINASEYEQIKISRLNLLEFLFMEEKLDFIVENYLEFETELLSIATRYSLSNHFDG